ncbi:hypothetical protein Dimus_022322, partial [Dionaea muscipula]
DSSRVKKQRRQWQRSQRRSEGSHNETRPQQTRSPARVGAAGSGILTVSRVVANSRIFNGSRASDSMAMGSRWQQVRCSVQQLAMR